MFRRLPRALTGALVCAWLMLGVAPCLMAAPVESHDCAHCETPVVAAPSCELPADLLPVPSGSTGDGPEQSLVLPPWVADLDPRVHAVFHPPPDTAPPPRRSILHRFCRLLE